MIMTSNKYCKIIGYKIIGDKGVQVTFECVKCERIFTKILRFGVINTINCNGCKYRFVIVPKEYDNANNDIIDYYVLSYDKTRSILKNSRIANKIKTIKDKEIKDNIKYNYILNVLNEINVILVK